MAGNSEIEWTDATWNPVTGCNKISPGCKNCYAETLSKRLKAMGQEKYQNGFEVTLHPDVINQPTKWRKPRLVFVNSMSDLFHVKVPEQFILDVFQVMNETPQHTYQVLTKRPERLETLQGKVEWTPNIWMGTSVESELYLHRIGYLRDFSQARVKFLSVEPLLGPLTALITHPRRDEIMADIGWVIVGGESGRQGKRLTELRPEWVRPIRDLCATTGTPFFFKQWGGTNKKRTGRLLDGVEWNQMPARELAGA